MLLCDIVRTRASFFELERFIPFGVSARVDAAKKDIEFGS